jgi:hypothetical protein
MNSHGQTSWPFAATINGTISIGPGLATWFGGDSDPQDDGTTASGVNTKGNPGLMGCALPMTDCGESATQGSPIPHLDWFQAVQVTNLDTGSDIGVPLIDIGPGRSANAHAKSPEECHIIDLTIAAFKALGGDVNAGTMRVQVLILDQVGFHFPH